MAPHNMQSYPRLSCALLLGVLGMAVFYNAERASGHQFAIENRLSDPLLADCQSKYTTLPEQQIMPGKRYVYWWFQNPVRNENFECGFSWLNTPLVKEFSVWNLVLPRNNSERLCDVCEWKVESSGFSIKAIDKGQLNFTSTYAWEPSCLAASLEPL